MYPKEKSLRLLFTILTLTGLPGCRSISSPASAKTQETPPLIATHNSSPSATPPILSSPTSLPPTEISSTPLPPPVPETTPTSEIPQSFYQIDGVLFDDPKLATHLSLELPDGTSIEVDAVFKTDKTGKNLNNLCTTGTGSICTFSDHQRLFLTPHAGYSEDKPLEGELIRRFIEGGIMFQNTEDQIQQQLFSLRGRPFSITNNNHTITGPILFAYRVAGNNLPEFLGDFVGGPDWIAARDPSLLSIVDRPGLTYIQLCGHRRRHEKEIAGLEDNIYSRIVIAVDFTNQGRATFASLDSNKTTSSVFTRPITPASFKSSFSPAEARHFSSMKYQVPPLLRRGRQSF